MPGFARILRWTLVFALCATVAHSKSIITEWNPIIIDATIADTPQPTIGTRTMMIVFTSAYEAWAAFHPEAMGPETGNALDGSGGEATPEAMDEAVSHAIYTALMAVAPSNQAVFERFMADRGYGLNDGAPAAALGRTAAKAVLQSRENDGSNHQNGYADTTGYTPQDPSNPAAWQPLPVPLDDPNGTLQKPLTPHWGGVTPVAIDVRDYRLAPPAQPGTPEWDAQIEQLIEINANLTNREKVIAEYWRPVRGTPPMLWGELTAAVSEKYGYGLAEDAKLYFAIHCAMFDAGISCWENKYHYDYVRPVTAIRNLGDRIIQGWGGIGMGPVSMPASQWLPYQSENQPTPPFPEYASGHSTFGSSWAEIMMRFTGSGDFGHGVRFDELFFEKTPLDPPVELYWETFSEAAAEAGMSRLYGGIHFMDGNLRAQEAGRRIGAEVWAKCQSLFGTASSADGWEGYR